ncbi:protein-glutamate O-methyltransferase CheR [Arsukibacterium sp.]|uniref:CheR family methyltransferase n=1 Tax=Arsukibacterium sp. TaxID=1977258 RepID=UPI00356794EA
MDIVLKDKEFDSFQRWLYQTAGIKLTPAKKALVAGRLFKRLKHFQLLSYSEYFSLIIGGEYPAELQLALDLLTTNETYFFREPKHFEYLSQKILPQASTSRPFRIWSAASSSGEEAYTLAMVLSENLAFNQWQLFGSDISNQVLEQARSGHYPLNRAENIPKPLLQKYCLKGIGSQQGTFIINKQLREKIQFRQINLVEPFPDLGLFDVIFLRNVMIYFDHDTKQKVVAKMLPLLRNGGYFIVSLSESLNGVTDGLKLITPSIYQKP